MCFSFSFSFFSPDIWVFVFFLYFGLQGSHVYSEEKQKTKNLINKRLGRDILKTCKNSESISQKPRGHLSFCAAKCKSRLDIVITWF